MLLPLIVFRRVKVPDVVCEVGLPHCDYAFKVFFIT